MFDIQRTIEAVWRMDSPKIIASLARRVGDLSLAEDLAQEALVIALERWPETGIPENPAAWLMGVASHRYIDRVRRDATLERKQELLGRDLELQQVAGGAEIEAALEVEVEDDLLRLIFTACHPVLSTEARVALTLRMLGGLGLAIARSLVTAHGGEIEAHSEPGRGTTITFTIPLSESLFLATMLGVVNLPGAPRQEQRSPLSSWGTEALSFPSGALRAGCPSTGTCQRGSDEGLPDSKRPGGRGYALPSNHPTQLGRGEILRRQNPAYAPGWLGGSG